MGQHRTLAFPKPSDVMREFGQWIEANTTGRPVFVSDNNGFDWQFINWYFQRSCEIGASTFQHEAGGVVR
jgi:hypothetical protein